MDAEKNRAVELEINAFDAGVLPIRRQRLMN